jgi:hypothetical protein
MGMSFSCDPQEIDNNKKTIAIGTILVRGIVLETEAERVDDNFMRVESKQRNASGQVTQRVKTPRLS